MWIWIEIYKWRTCPPFCVSLDDSAFSFLLNLAISPFLYKWLIYWWQEVGYIKF
jgi:hypothetical protein